jgi:hypothetical protein
LPISRRRRSSYADHLDVVADRGYFNSVEILACEQADITVTLSKADDPGAKTDGHYGTAAASRIASAIQCPRL